MRAFVAISSLLAACRAEASLPLAYNGYALSGIPYAAAYSNARIAPYATQGAVLAAASTYGGYAAPLVAAAPVVAAAAPVVAAKSVAVAAAPSIAAPSITSSQYRSGDEYGNTAFGYSNINSARQEQGNAAGVTGSYSYRDEAGLHQVNYVADAYGFRATRAKRSIVAAPAAYAAAPLAATYAAAPLAATYAAAPLAAHYAAAPLAATYAAAPLAATYAAAPHAASYAAAPLAATYAAAPLAAATYAAPSAAAGREAILTTIKLNPGHATFYRVD